MELSKIIKFLALEEGIEEVDFLEDVKLCDEGNGVFIKEWNLPFAKPTLADLEIAAPLAAAAEASMAYKALRAEAFPPIEEQLDMIYWDSVNGTSLWEELVESIKTQFPKG